MDGEEADVGGSKQKGERAGEMAGSTTPSRQAEAQQEPPPRPDLVEEDSNTGGGRGGRGACLVLWLGNPPPPPLADATMATGQGAPEGASFSGVRPCRLPSAYGRRRREAGLFPNPVSSKPDLRCE